MGKSYRKPYKIIGAYDSETTNINESGEVYAFPVLHQLGLLDVPVIDVSADNVEEHVSIELYRHALDLYRRFDDIANERRDFVPVICCHNLSFDMYGLSSWLMRHDVRVLAKSQRKPITFTILDENGNPALVLWDTLIFSQQGLARMGEDCGYMKAVGEWDYDLIRTPYTPLTDKEIDYAKKDIYALLAWLGWWLKRNPDIEPEKLGLNVVTKTGVVRERRKVRFDQMRGDKLKQNVGRFWLYQNREQAPKTDDELFTMQASTRGGFTFCASKYASIPLDLRNTGDIIAAFDATSMHPAQMVSHRYPINFKQVDTGILQDAFEIVTLCKIDKVLEKWSKPFPVAFYGSFEFENLRPKKDSLFAENGIFPLASARYKPFAAEDEENGDKVSHDNFRFENGYADSALDPVCAFGKLISAKRARLYLTELAAWEVAQAYEWDNVRAISGYYTGRFVRPTDMSTISVMQFYQAKNEYKKAREQYYKSGTIDNADKLKDLGVAPAIVDSMQDGTIATGDIEATYLSLKADLNALFGIECSNEYRRNTVLNENGISFDGSFGICNSPKNPKAWYQFGQRIVGWSRIAQICAMILCEPYIKGIVNGDTDSIKLLCKKGQIDNIQRALKRLGHAIDKGKRDNCSRVRLAYPDVFDPLENIGHYVLEFQTECFCASWNKAYCIYNGEYSFTLAGIPTKRRVSANSCFIGVNGYANRLSGLGMTFSDICNLLLGYNVTYAYDLLRLNARKFPEWGALAMHEIEDYKGVRYRISEPCALALYPMSKTVNDISSKDNRLNMAYALKNNMRVNTEPCILHAGGITYLGEVFGNA